MASSIRASHILLMYAGSMRSTADRSKEDAQTQIAALRDKIAGGEDFGAVAREVSDCPSGADGGDLGEFRPGMMVASFDKAAFGLEVGEMSGVVETPFGYHLILRTA